MYMAYNMGATQIWVDFHGNLFYGNCKLEEVVNLGNFR